MSSLDYIDLCRLCLVKDHVNVPIFEGEGDVRQIFLKIAACLPVKVAREDKLPKKICDDCVYKVESFYQFWNTTASAEKQLFQWIGEDNLEDKQGYVNVMKQEQNSENRFGSNVIQVAGNQNNMDMRLMDNMGLGMPIIISSSNQQQISSVPLDSADNSVTQVQAVPSSSSHEQMSQSQTNIATQEDDDDESDDDNMDDECDGDEGLSVKEEGEDELNSNKNIESTTFVNVGMTCDQAGPSGLQQQKITEMTDIGLQQTSDEDPKSGSSDERDSGIFIFDEESIAMRKWQILEFDGKPYYAFVPENVTPLDENVLSESEEQIDPDIKLEKPQAIKYKEDSLDSFPVDENTYEDEEFEEMMEEDEEEEEEEERIATVKQTRSRTKASAAKIKVEDMILDLDAEEMEDSVGYLIENYDDESSPEKASSSEVTLKCKVCSETFASNLLFRKHVAWIHKKKVYIKEDNVFVCCVCDYQTNKKNLFALHLQRKHKNLTTNKQTGNVFPCAACGFECRSKHSLQSHFIRKHTDRYEHQCKFCTKQFKVKGDLTNHVRFHHKEKPINCDVCGKLCLNSGSLYVHQKWAHYKPKFECPICKRRMVTQENLDQHMISQHEKREKIVCAECGKTFSKKDSFKRHMAVHTGSKPHCCVICQKHFARRSQLRQHLLIHTGKKPFVCDICGKAFTQKPGLICHRKIHPGPHPPLPVMPIGDIVKEFTEGYYADPFNQDAEAEQDSE